VEVRELDDIADLHRVAALFREIWDAGAGAMPVTPELLRALADHGGYVVGAFVSDGTMVGASAGFTGMGDRLELHSHITGVHPGVQGTGAGFALKQHQRRWALERGIEVITWTFDPLVRRNGRFNLVKLGAVITGYREHYYGDMADGINVGEESDRCLVEWRLTGERPQPGDDTLVCDTPDDIVALRRTDRSTARAWRLSVRETMAPALATGYVGVGMTDTGAYILTR
jgi:predicted GNAT superfamily acetyltransferase